MKAIHCFFAFILISGYGPFMRAQCPENITFTTQGQIDSFQISYPGCSEILGNAIISGADIINLNGLTVLTATGGTLDIVDNASLKSLYGLHQLKSVGGSLRIGDNPILNSLEGLEKLSSVGDCFSLFRNASLPSLLGLKSLSSIGHCCYNTSECWGLFSIYIYGNPAFTSLSGMDKLDTIQNDLAIAENNALTTLTGLGHLAYLGGLVLFENDNLTWCAVESICHYLADSPNGTWINYNAAGCNSEEEIGEGCSELTALNNVPDTEKWILFPNPASDYLSIQLPVNITQPIEISLFDPKGQLVARQRISAGQSTDLSGLAPGMYWVKVVVGERVYSLKFVKN